MLGEAVLERVTVTIGESAGDQIRRDASVLTAEKRAALVSWLEALNSRKLLSVGVALEGLGSEKVYEFKGAEFTVRFVIGNGAPLVTQLLFN